MPPPLTCSVLGRASIVAVPSGVDSSRRKPSRRLNGPTASSSHWSSSAADMAGALPAPGRALSAGSALWADTRNETSALREASSAPVDELAHQPRVALLEELRE